MTFDPIKKAGYYNSHPSGVETKQVTFYLSGLLAAAVKYLWRAGQKDSLLLDLKKAAWCFKDEAARLEADGGPFEISERWVEPARRVIAANFAGPMTVADVLLRQVLGTLLAAREHALGLAAMVAPQTRAKAVAHCSALVQIQVDKLERAPLTDEERAR